MFVSPLFAPETVVLALVAVALYIDDDIRHKALQKLRDMFGELDDADIGDIYTQIGV
jgi:hypothetical protein